jgi:hypothetical protein
MSSLKGLVSRDKYFVLKILKIKKDFFMRADSFQIFAVFLWRKSKIKFPLAGVKSFTNSKSNQIKSKSKLTLFKNFLLQGG